MGDVGDYFADFCAKVGDVMRKTYWILLLVGEVIRKTCSIFAICGETVQFLAVFRWLGGCRWLYSMLSAFAADDGKKRFFLSNKSSIFLFSLVLQRFSGLVFPVCSVLQLRSRRGPAGDGTPCSLAAAWIGWSRRG